MVFQSEMNKLQLYICKSLRGFKSVRNINPSESVQNCIRDWRGALDCLDYDPAEKHLFYLVNYIDDGVFFTILRTIPDKPSDHLATTIFVPAGLDVSPGAMEEVVGKTVDVVSNPSVSADDMADLQEIFSREYPRYESPAAMVASQGRQYAVCLYGGDTGRTLSDFFNDCLYQTSYLPYAGVILVDKQLDIPFDCDDVSGIILQQPVELLPPEGEADGFTPHLFHHVFNRPFLVSQGSEVDIVWRRGGFEEKTQTVTVDSPDMAVQPISGADCRKTITPASFYITSHQGKSVVKGAVITVNGVLVDQPRTFTLSELQNADVHISAPGFAPFVTTLDLASTTQALIQLQEHRKVYRFEMPVRSAELGAPIHFEIHTKRELSGSPLEGYQLIDEELREGHTRTNRLEYVGDTSGFTRRHLIAGAVVLVAGIVLGWAASAIMRPSASAETSAGEVPVEQAMTEAPAKEEPKAAPVQKKEEEKKPAADERKADAPRTAKADAAAIAYLDKNTVWRRDEMAKFKDLDGLFDDMDNFNSEAIAGRWAATLSASERFAKVAQHVSDGARKKIFVPKGKYCKEGDNAISVQTYLNTVDPAKPAK